MPSQTQVGPGTLVELSYTLFDEDGDPVDVATSDDPLAYVHGYGQIVPGLERALEGMTAGQKREVVVEAREGYGERDPEGVFELDKAEFPEADKVKLEDEFEAEGPDGHAVLMRIVEILPESFMVDLNHPLAGQRLRFEVTVEDVRPATDEEIAAAEEEMSGDHDHAGCCGEDHDHEHDHEHAHGHGTLIQLGKKGAPPKPS